MRQGAKVVPARAAGACQARGVNRIVATLLAALGLIALTALTAAPSQAEAATRIVYAHKGKLLALSPQGGSPRTIARVPVNTFDLAASADGRRFVLITNRYLPYPERGSIRAIYVLDLGRGMRRVFRQQTTGELEVALSRDGHEIGFAKEGEVWVMNANGSGRRQVTDNPGRAGAFGTVEDLAFTPSGEEVVFARWTEGLYRAPLSGGEETRLWGDSGDLAVAPDGRIVCRSVLGKGAEGLVALSPDGDHPRMIAPDRHKDYALDPTWSPDGGSIAYRRRLEEGGLASTYRYSFHVVSGGQRRQLIGDIHPLVRSNGSVRAPTGPVWVPVP